jgi:hypothetical protein
MNDFIHILLKKPAHIPLKKKGEFYMALKCPIILKSNLKRRLKMNITFKDMNSMKEGLIPATILLISVICLIGFNVAEAAAPPMSIHYLATSRSHTATMQVNDKAADVWQSVVDIAKKRNPGNLEVKEENKEKLKFEASKKMESGETLWGSIKVTPLSATSCRLIFTATMSGGKPLEKEMKDLILNSLLTFCDEKGLTCNVIE